MSLLRSLLWSLLTFIAALGVLAIPWLLFWLLSHFGLENNDWVIATFYKGGSRGRNISAFFDFIPSVVAGLVLGLLHPHRAKIRFAVVVLLLALAAWLNVVGFQQATRNWPVPLLPNRNLLTATWAFHIATPLIVAAILGCASQYTREQWKREELEKSRQVDGRGSGAVSGPASPKAHSRENT